MVPKLSHRAFFNRNKSWYYVLYNDGECSMTMPKYIAINYAEIFGGKVILHPDAPKKKWWQFWKEGIISR